MKAIKVCKIDMMLPIKCTKCGLTTIEVFNEKPSSCVKECNTCKEVLPHTIVDWVDN